MNTLISKYLFALSCMMFVITAGLYLSENLTMVGVPLILFFLTLALGMRVNQRLKGFSFTVLILAAVSLSMFFPQTLVLL